MNKNGRTLIYTTADREYAHWIPLYCLGMLYHNKNIDIEIGIEGRLNDDDKESIEYLKKRYPQSKILIKENFFEYNGTYAKINDIECKVHTVRFITTPILKDEFVYIGDIDIICLEKDIFSQHIEFMEHESMCYSNIVRKSYPYGLSGLHFSIYNCYYPLPSFEGLDLMGIDEVILKNLVIRNGITLNESVDWRPTHGVHFSRNRPSISGDGKIPGWGADPYKKEWNDFTSSEEFKYIYERTTYWIKKLVEKLDNYYNDDGSEIFNSIKPIMEFEAILSDKRLKQLGFKNEELYNINNRLFEMNSIKLDNIISQNKEINKLIKKNDKTFLKDVRQN